MKKRKKNLNSDMLVIEERGNLAFYVTQYKYVYDIFCGVMLILYCTI